MSQDNESYFIGCDDGSVHVIKALDFSYIDMYEFKKDDSNQLTSPVTDIFANKLIFIVCFLNGDLHFYERDFESGSKKFKFTQR